MKKKPKKNPVIITKELPKYLEKYEGSALTEDNFGPEDVTWRGDNWDIDSDELIKEHGYDPVPPLHWILLAIIDAHPSPKHPDDRNRRLHEALRALTQTRGGRPLTDDHDLLLEIGWRYHVAKYETGQTPELRPIVRDIVETLPPDHPRIRHIEKSSLIKKLEDKFKANKDVIIARATYDKDRNRMDIAQAVSQVIERLNDLGIPADKSAVQPRVLNPESFAANKKDETPPR